MNLVLKQFSEGRFRSVLTEYNKIIGHKNAKTIDNVIPYLSDNLSKSTEAFIEAVINQDAEFIEQTATHAVQKKLLKELQDLKAHHVQIKSVPLKSKSQQKPNIENKDGEKKDLKNFLFSPYVIFGQKMAERFESLTPWQSTAPILGLNRYLYVNPVEGFSWQKLKNDHVYGFHCYYQNISKAYQVIEGSKITDHPPKQFIVTFQTDAVNQQFFVADFNYIVRYDL